MSSTNKTTYYELPQFVDNDIFNPLVDDNDAYSKIDTALHNIADAEADNASEIVGVKSRLDSAEGDIDALETQNGNSVLTTTAQTLSGAVNELDAVASALDGRLDIVEDDINNVSTGLKAKVAALETQNGSAELTTVAQTLSGAVNELDALIKSGFVTPEMYGAVGDGVTDDTQAFIDMLSDNKNFIYIHGGTYVISSSLAINDNTYILCKGKILDNRQGAEASIIGLFDINNKSNVTLDGVHVVGTGALNYYITGGVIVARNDSKHIRVTNCIVENTPYIYAICTYDHGDDVIIDKCSIKEFSYGGICNVSGCDNFTVKDCVVINPHGFDGSNTYPISLGLYDGDYNLPVRVSKNLKAVNNYVEADVEFWEGIETHYGNNIEIANNVIKGTRDGIALAGGQVRDGITLTIDNVIISNNIIIGVGNSGTASPTKLHCGISSNHVNKAVYSNNYIEGFGELRSNGADPIIYLNDTNKCQIIGNNIRGGASDNNNAYGVLASNCDNVFIDGNTFSDGSVYVAFRIDGCGEIIMSNNKISNFATRGITGASTNANDHYYRTYNNESDMRATADPAQFVPQYCLPTQISDIKYGRLGDIIYNQTPSSGNPIGWICTTASTVGVPAVYSALPNL